MWLLPTSGPHIEAAAWQDESASTGDPLWIKQAFWINAGLQKGTLEVTTHRRRGQGSIHCELVEVKDRQRNVERLRITDWDGVISSLGNFGDGQLLMKALTPLHLEVSAPGSESHDAGLLAQQSAPDFPLVARRQKKKKELELLLPEGHILWTDSDLKQIEVETSGAQPEGASRGFSLKLAPENLAPGSESTTLSSLKLVSESLLTSLSSHCINEACSKHPCLVGPSTGTSSANEVSMVKV